MPADTLPSPNDATSAAPASVALLAARAHAEVTASMRNLTRMRNVLPPCAARDEVEDALRSLMYVTQQLGALVSADQARLMTVRAAGPLLLSALEGLVEMIERAAEHGVDTTGHIGVGDALHAIAVAKGRE
jgi:hypothetical protein